MTVSPLPVGSLPATPAQSIASLASTGTTPAATSASASNGLGKDTFLKLLVAQLEYQDPSHPADSTQFLSQTATFTQVEKLTDIDTALTALLASQQTAVATGLLGRQVTWNDSSSGRDVGHTGVVSGVSASAAGPVLSVTAPGSSAPTTVDLAQITEVTATPTG
jgi:flagellar basal-body rod modification protein FlgD